jgi:lysophospholipase L1-like esterase
MRLRLAVLGDSIGAGHGAAVPEEQLARRLAQGLRDEGFDARGRVFALAGAGSDSLAGQVDKALEWEPQVAVIVIGANDVVHRRPPQEAADLLTRAVERLRERDIEVVVAPAPDLSTAPRVPSFLRRSVRAASEKVRRAQVVAASAAGAVIADGEGRTSELFRRDPSLFSADRFHPSSAGYAVIAGELFPHVLTAAKRAVET